MVIVKKTARLVTVQMMDAGLLESGKMQRVSAASWVAMAAGAKVLLGPTLAAGLAQAMLLVALECHGDKCVLM